jgi:hypothetical protein
MNYKLKDVESLSIWMIERIAQNKDVALDQETGCDWDWVASEVWANYQGFFNEFVINESIDLIVEAAECSD